MTRRRAGSLLTALTAFGFFATAALHGSGYASVTRLAAEGSPELGLLVPALWLVFSLDLMVLGMIVAALAPGTPDDAAP